MRYVLFAFALAGAAGCSSNGGGTAGTQQTQQTSAPEPEPTTVGAANDFVGITEGEILLNSNGEKIIVNIDGIIERVNIDTLDAIGTFRGGIHEDELHVFLSETDRSRAGIMAFYDGSLDEFEYSTQFARIDDTTIPLSGTATLNGGYVGFLYVVDRDEQYRMQGVAEFVTNFTEGTFRGRISDREITNFDGSTEYDVEFADIVLNLTDITDAGGFAGSLIGGHILRDDEFTEGSGTYQGLVAGANGDEVVGGLELTYMSDNDDVLNEIGTFAGGH